MEREQFDRVNELESYLSNYKMSQTLLKNLKLEVESLEETILQSIDYSKDSAGKTNKFNSEVENLITRKEELKNKIKHLEMRLKQIDNSFEALEDEEKKIIENKFFKGKYYS